MKVPASLLAGALLLAGCGSSGTPEPKPISYEATNPAQVVEEHDGVQYVYLTQGPAYFAEDSIRLHEGLAAFYVTNDTDNETTLTIVPFGDRDFDRTVLSLKVPPGQTASEEVELAKGLYEYSCPVNPTEWYPLEVVRGSGPDAR